MNQKAEIEKDTAEMIKVGIWPLYGKKNLKPINLSNNLEIF